MLVLDGGHRPGRNPVWRICLKTTGPTCYKIWHGSHYRGHEKNISQ
jgi:hypothetical protein